jgi:hypothetical protein
MRMQMGLPKRMPAFYMAAGASVAASVISTAAAAGPIVEASGDACKLLNAAQVSAVLGVPVDEGAYELPGHTQFCIWPEHGKPNEVAQNVQVNFITPHQYTAAKTGPFSKGAESSLGDDAYWGYTPGIGYTLSVQKGSTYFRVHSRPIPKGVTRKADTPEDKAKWDEKEKTVDRAIAQEVLKRL